MTEEERIAAIPRLNNWKHQDDTVRDMVTVVLTAEGQQSVGHLARFRPDAFDELYEEAEVMMGNDT